MNVDELALKLLNDQINYLEKHVSDSEKERNETRHKYDLAQQRYELLYGQLEVYRNIIGAIKTE